MLTIQHIEEGLSRAYLMAVAARAGVNIGAQQHDYGVDGTIARIRILDGGRHVEDGIKFDFQLKATTKWRLNEDNVSYSLEAKTYNDMVERCSRLRTVPLLLVLMCLPDEQRLWLENDEEHLLLRRCCYWMTLAGNSTINSSTVAVRIPRSQLLTPDSLIKLLDEVAAGRIQ